MSGCNGNCGSCGGGDNSGFGGSGKSPSCVPIGKVQHRQAPISKYLEPPDKTKKDNTPLDHPCKCVDYLKDMPRYTCEKCITSWVEANDLAAAQEEYNKLIEIGKRIAAERLLKAIDAKIERNLFDDSQCDKC